MISLPPATEGRRGVTFRSIIHARVGRIVRILDTSTAGQIEYPESPKTATLAAEGIYTAVEKAVKFDLLRKRSVRHSGR